MYKITAAWIFPRRCFSLLKLLVSACTEETEKVEEEVYKVEV